MKPISLILFIILVVVACHRPAVHKVSKDASLPDSINCLLEALDTDTIGMERIELPPFQVAAVHWGKDLVAVYVAGTFPYVIRRTGGIWRMVDSISAFGLWRMDTMDLNGDHLTDLLVLGEPSEVGGNFPCTPVLGRDDGALQVRNDGMRWNFQYRKEGNVVLSWWLLGGFYSPFKEVHKWVDDSLVLVMGVRKKMFCYDDGNSCCIQFYRRINGLEVITREMKGDDSITENIYDTALYQLPHYEINQLSNL